MSGDLMVGTFSCSRGRVLVGQQRLKCRRGSWSDSIPVCTGESWAELPVLSDERFTSEEAGQEIVFIVNVWLQLDTSVLILSFVYSNRPM